jgi:hypothetical protein
MAQRETMAGARQAESVLHLGADVQRVSHWRHEQAGRAAMTIKDIGQTLYLAALIAFATWGFVG